MATSPKKRATAPKAHPSELIRAPQLPRQIDDGYGDALHRRDIAYKAAFSKIVVRGANLSATSAEKVAFDVVLFDGVELSDTNFDELDLTDSRLETCAISNALWHKSSLNRVEIVGSRGQGLQLNESFLRHVVFDNCSLAYAQFRVARFEHVKFVNCNLRGADFSQADLRGVAFTDCELREADFSYSKLEGTDLRTSTLDNIRVGAESLKGVIVEPMQAAYLCKIMGLDVRWE
ncbi:pentapeptide repeat-containing protein [bacterium]|nr:MAG: pentapeptide repeat-containing protein [bacterium]